MLKSINGWTFPKGTPWAEAARLAKEAGFQAIEPTLEAEGELTPASDEAECRRIGDDIRAAGLEVASLATGLFWDKNYTAEDPLVREEAKELTRAVLLRAKWLGAPVVLVVPGLVSHPRNPARQVTTYCDALRRSHEALCELCHDAEAYSITLAIENVWNQFLISPVEMCEFVDRVNSPWFGVYLDIGNVLRYGFPQDWIETLGHRLVRVHLKDFKLEVGNRTGFCPLGEGDVDWQAVMAALVQQRYDGPLTYEGKGDLEDIRADRSASGANPSYAKVIRGVWTAISAAQRRGWGYPGVRDEIGRHRLWRGLGSTGLTEIRPRDICRHRDNRGQRPLLHGPGIAGPS